MTNSKEQLIAEISLMVETLLNDANPVNANESLVLSQRLSSLQVVELASQIEQKYQIDFSEIGFNPNDFETVGTIADLILASK